MPREEPSMNPKGVLEKRKKMLNRFAEHRRWYSINNKDDDVAEVRIYDEIGWFGTTAEDFVKELDEITAPKMIVAINSPGGDVFDGIAIFNALRTHPAEVTTRVDSIAASASSVIAQAGDHRIMLTGSQQMIHKAWGLLIGNSDDAREFADLLDKQDDIIANVYAARGTKSTEHYKTLMSKETWMNAEEAVAEGLADEVVDPAKDKDAVTNAAPAKRTLNDELMEAIGVVSTTIDSVEEVAALRAKHGDHLSQTVRSSLDELGQRLEKLQTVEVAESPDGEEDDTPSEDEDELLRLKTQLESLRV